MYKYNKHIYEYTYLHIRVFQDNLTNEINFILLNIFNFYSRNNV